MKNHEYERYCQEGETMPDPLLSSSGKGLVSIPIAANEKSGAVFWDFCYEYHSSIVKNQIMRPLGRSPCEGKCFEDRRRLNTGFLRSFFVFIGMVDGGAVYFCE